MKLRPQTLAKPPDDQNTVSTLSMFTRQTETVGKGLQPQFIALIVVSCSSFIMAVILITLLYRRCVGRRRNKPTMTLESDEEGYRTYEEIRETALTAEKRRVKDDKNYEHPMRKSEETDRTYEQLTPSQDPAACSKRLKTAPSHPDMRTEHDRPLAGAHPGKSDCSPLSHQVFTGAYFLPEQESPYLIPVTEDKVTCQLSAPHFHENQTRSVLESPYLTTVWDAKMQLCAENPYLTPVVDRKQTSYHFAHT
ncbi:hypothetical protein C0Q70_12473 [Pomacea canaliculata]|uniref:Uncharacterized protein n=1 Tax=Pomacea canaliculata TaxID=400727 RepID=A0A2T7P1L8_POMCA|nr:uncharacterized protein LOC112568641 [Pomacea canaliculata]PVD27317.1 hypothetical protein C0Q70_12473 [Pomacea canaliculata]